MVRETVAIEMCARFAISLRLIRSELVESIGTEVKIRESEFGFRILVRCSAKGRAEHIRVFGRGLFRELHVQAVGTLLELHFAVGTQ